MTPQIGLLLCEWRTTTGLSLGKLAQKAGVDKSALSRWETGGRQPRVPELEATLDALNASPAQRAQAFASIDAPRSIRRLRQRPDIAGLGAPPAAGDLLRALRQRRGWTQEQTAAQLGVGQSAVARWEQGENLPSSKQIQALCYALEAHEDEIIALTTNRFTETDASETNVSEGEQEECLRDALTRILEGNGPEGSVDLIMLTMERKAWLLATRRESARALLAHILARHAEMHRNAHRWAAVGPLARRALALISRQEKEPDFILRAAIMSASAAVYAGNQIRSSHGLYALKNWLSHSTLPIYTAWIQSDMAKYAALSGQTAASLTLGEQACQSALVSGDPVEIYLRQLDYARLLVEAREPEAALRALPAPLFIAENQFATDLLLYAEAHLLAGNLCEAQDWLQRSLTVIQTHDLNALQEAADTLAQRF